MKIGRGERLEPAAALIQTFNCFIKRFERLERSAAVERLERSAVSAQRLERSAAIERLERFEPNLAPGTGPRF